MTEHDTTSIKDVEFVLEDQFGISRDRVDSVKLLAGYDDQNFYVKLKPDGREVLLKITNWRDSENVQLIGEMTELMCQLGKSVPCSVPLQTKTGSPLGRYVYQDSENHRRECIVRLFNFLPGKIMTPGTITRSQAFQWGDLLGRMHLALDSMEFPTISERTFIWAWEGVPQVKRYLDVVSDQDRKDLAQHFFDKYEYEMLPRMRQLKRDLIHGDLNERNVLTNAAGEVYAVLDFGDCHGGPRAWDLALVLAYLSLMLPDIQRDLVNYLGDAISGYAKHMPNVVRDTCDVETLKTLICTRLCQSLVLGLQSFKVKCDPYVLTTQKKGWFVLRQLHSETRQNITDVWNKLLKPYGMMLKETAH
ncbi:hydroxylysine kinase-like isoform X2 [Varroa jacobsoni]|uniref:Hydroxylysine kinase n=1 Tax=Varroa destructor TaxID=109461 RepID=A0A7M7KDX8_VARDE|nr:hydroxylysine kinase-like isoform X2 [Varroa destructor]XP_022664394.1 hydroxylysine kinase-like isoform X2 [Varroa destructor]XP_022699144.1 hydroxylysine kinase-like isoform X2 [Varroa jacobsoni]XP_022699145.1 hydroxylysine kinase-like isoform X2 [Varroa jacobsoni]